MTLPVVIGRTVVPAASRAIVRRVNAWAATASISKLQKFNAFLKRHPRLTTIAGTIGASSILESALNGDPDSIEALNDFAREAGIDLHDGATSNSVGGVEQQQEKSFFERAYDAVFEPDDKQVVVSDQPAVLSDTDAERARELSDFARFIRSEISGSPEFVLRHHALMRKYLAMDVESLENLLKAY